MADQLAIGVDLGGTKIAFVLIDEQGTVVLSSQLPTRPEEGENAVLDRIAQGIAALLGEAGRPVAGIGIGSPGWINLNTGVVVGAVNLRWRNVPLVEGVRQRLAVDLPIWIQKDTNAGALGEMFFGAARGCTDFVYIAIGTGLGLGAVVNGQLIIGSNFYATDIGHLALNPQGRQCACGLRGCVEMYVSGVGLLAGVREHQAAYPQSPLAQREDVTTVEILQQARGGDPLGRRVIDEAADWLGLALIYSGMLLNPALFVIGGGLGHAAWDLLIERAEREFRQRTLFPVHQKARIVRGEITVSAVGAACLVWDQLGVRAP